MTVRPLGEDGGIQHVILLRHLNNISSLLRIFLIAILLQNYGCCFLGYFLHSVRST